MKNSIIAGKLARELENELVKLKSNSVASTVHQSGSYDLWLHGRYCTVDGKRSGGVVIWGDLKLKPELKHTSHSPTIYKRLRNSKYIYRHAADIAETLRQKIAVLQWREAWHSYATSGLARSTLIHSS